MTEKIACAVNNIAAITTLDFAPQLIIADISQGTILHKTTASLHTHITATRACRLKNAGITTILCGAVSDALSLLLWHYGITITSGLSGDGYELLTAFTTGDLHRYTTDDFSPGFRGRHRFGKVGRIGHCQTSRQFPPQKRSSTMPNRDGTGQRSGSGGRMGGPVAGGPGGICICQKCGFTEPHQRRKPCTAKTCPQCGAEMTRQ